MEKIKSDDLLLKILSFLPTKDAVKASALSKRWQFLWMWLPKLEYDDSKIDKSRSSLMRLWVDRNLPLHRAPVIDSLRLNIETRWFQPVDVKFLVLNAVFRSVRELSVRYLCSEDKRLALLPSNLYICKSLVALELEGSILVNVRGIVCLLSLKTLILRCVRYVRGGSLNLLLSSCPNLVDLTVERHAGSYGEPMRVIIPSLQRLTIKLTQGCHYNGLVISTPSLKFLEFTNSRFRNHHGFNVKEVVDSPIQNMPKLVEAYIDSKFLDIPLFIENIIGPITSVKRLSFCYNQKFLYGEGIVFKKLEHLMICSCPPKWTNLLVSLLRDSPSLRKLVVYHMYGHCSSRVDPSSCWNNQLSEVPKCLLRSLQTFKWTEFHGSEKEMDMVKYILKNALCLKNAAIIGISSYDSKEKLEMIEELSFFPRGSTSCKLTLF